MISRFYCKECDQVFDAEGTKIEYMDPVFGPCARYVTNCPTCDTESKEYIKPKQFKSVSLDSILACGNPNTCCPGCQG